AVDPGLTMNEGGFGAAFEDVQQFPELGSRRTLGVDRQIVKTQVLPAGDGTFLVVPALSRIGTAQIDHRADLLPERALLQRTRTELPAAVNTSRNHRMEIAIEQPDEGTRK